MEDVAAPGLRQAGLVHRRNTGSATRRTVGRTTRQINRWTFGQVGFRRRYISMDIEAPRPWSLRPE